MTGIKISAVSYYNTLPFVYGIKESNFLQDIELSLDIPATTASKLLKNEIDVGLIPVAAIPLLNQHYIISDFCIGGVGCVKTVALFAQKPLNQIKTIYLDPESRTSVRLARIIAANYWKLDFEWKSFENKEIHELKDDEGIVLIGDKTFPYFNRFAYCYDLSDEWKKMTNLPFVFAAWVSTQELPQHFRHTFNQALAWGVQNRNDSILLAQHKTISDHELRAYVNDSISYQLDAEKRKGLALFFKFLQIMKDIE